MKNHSKIFALLLASSVPAILFPSCHMTRTIRPTPVVSVTPSFDGNTQDSGLVEVTPAGALITSRFVARYNAMIDVYGDDPEFLPALKHDQGVSPASPEDSARHPGRGDLFIMDRGSLAAFIKMNQWRKMLRPPVHAKSPGLISKMFKAVF